MCGIAGIYAGTNQQQIKDIAEVMSLSMSHRGPDGTGVWFEDGVALCHRRLAIIDLTPGGHQPMISACKRYVITFNGEIYNYRNLKEMLKSYPFASSSDTEVILAAFAQWGTESFSRLRGQFAFCIYDRHEKRLIMARDRIGEKPFYYYCSNGTFLFASEMRALLSSGKVEAQINMKAVADYLRYQSVPGPETMIEGVYALPPASYGIFENGNLKISSYWSAGSVSHPKALMSRPELLTELKNTFSSAVKEQMQSDVPLGAFLSGGIDSSAIVAMMSQHTANPVNTFHVSFDQKDYDESLYAEMIARKFHTKHSRIILRPETLLDELPSILKAMDAPSGDGPNTYIISKAIKEQGIKVVMSGLGGDDLFAGYPGFLQYQKLQKIRSFWKLPAFVRSQAGAVMSKFIKDARGSKLRALLELTNVDLAAFYSWNRRIFPEQDLMRLAPGLTGTRDGLISKMESWLPGASILPLFGQYGLAELNGYTTDVLLKDADIMSMAHSIEIRCPFLDHRLIELALAIPDDAKYPHYPKQLLVEAISPALPDALVKRRKMGFSFPWDHWLRNDLAPFASANIESLAERSWFDKKEVRNYYGRFMEGDRTVHWSRIWLLVVLESWCRENLGQRLNVTA
jgi:asparagine synthase (glutamine-hydrolysing)